MELVLNGGKISDGRAHPSDTPSPRFPSRTGLERESPIAGEGVAIDEGLARLTAWEQGKLSRTETLAFFQDLVSSGLAWESTGAVRRMAAQLIREELIHR
jgi:hypothetical protein